MTRIFTAFVAAMLLCAPYAMGQQLENKRSTVSGVDYYISNFGIFGGRIQNGMPGFYWPRGSINSYLFGSGVWFAAEKNPIPYRPRIDTLQKLVFSTYNPNSGVSWATPGEFPGTDTLLGQPILYHSTEYDQANGTAFTSGRPAWPLWLPAGRSATTMFPGYFVPDNANRTVGSTYAAPAYLPVSEQWVARFHDGDLRRYEGYATSGVFPIGLQFQQMAYSWEQGDYSNVVVLQYEIVNVSGDTLHRCFVGQASDPDVGRADNDRVSIYRVNGRPVAGVAYTDFESTPLPYGTLVQVLLESPTVDANGFIRNADRRVLAGRHEISSFRNWTIQNDPATIEARYQFLSQPILDTDQGAGDKRTMLSVGPFSMAPGDTAHFAMAFAVYDTLLTTVRETGSPRLAGFYGKGLDAFITRLIRDYATEQFDRVMAVEDNATEIATNVAAAVVPNPARNAVELRFSTTNTGETSVAVFDNLGRVCIRKDLGELTAGAQHLPLDLTALNDGAYTAVITNGDEVQSVRLIVTR